MRVHELRTRGLVTVAVMAVLSIAHDGAGQGSGAAQGAATSSQESSSAPQEPGAPVFTSGIELATIDVSVVDQTGNPAVGLTAADFVLKVDGEPRTISKIQFVRQNAAAGPQTTETWSTNDGATGGRLIMLVVDQENTKRGTAQTFAKAAERLLDDLGPGDRVGVWRLPGGRVVDFTSHFALVRQRLRQVVASAVGTTAHRTSIAVGIAESLALERGDPIVIRDITDRECAWAGTALEKNECARAIIAQATEYAVEVRHQTQGSLFALRDLLGSLRNVPGPKTVILISGGLILDRHVDEASSIRDLAAAARVSLYVIHLDDTLSEIDSASVRASPSANEDRRMRRDGLFTLAGQARGTAFSVSGGSDQAYARLSRELTGYYLIGFETTAAERDGRAHDVGVQVNRRGLELRTRSVFTVDPKGDAQRSAEDRLSEALRLPLLSADVHVAMAAFSLPNPDSDKVRVLLAARVGRPQDDAPVTAVAYKVEDDNGRVLSSRWDSMERRDGNGQQYLGTVALDRGAYTVKLAALDADGRVGTVEHRFTAGLSDAGSLRVGDLLLNDPVRGKESSLRPAVEPKVTGDTLLAYLEIEAADAQALKNTTGAIEIAADANGAAVLKAPLRVAPNNTGRGITQGELAIDTLAPGDYVARAIVEQNGRPVVRVIRAFTFEPSSEVRSRRPAPASTPVAISRSTSGFDRSRVLSAPVLSHFLESEQATSASSSPAVAEAVASARRGDVSNLASALGNGAAPDAMTAFLRGVGLFSQGQLDPAAAAFREALRMDSDFAAATFYLGACYAAGGRDREAVGAWQTTLASDEEAPFVYSLASQAYQRLKDWNSAFELTQEAVQRFPDDPAVRMDFVRAAANAGKPADALTSLDEYLQQHQGDADALLIGMKIIYDTVADGKAVVSASKDEQRFASYLAAYRAARGSEISMAEQWQRTVFGKGRP